MFSFEGCRLLLLLNMMPRDKEIEIFDQKKDIKKFGSCIFLVFGHQNPGYRTGSGMIRIHLKCWIWIRIHTLVPFYCVKCKF